MIGKVVEHGRSGAADLDELIIGARGKVEALQTVVGGCKAKPRFGIIVPLLDCLAEVTLGHPVIAVTVIGLGLFQPGLLGSRPERRSVGDARCELLSGVSPFKRPCTACDSRSHRSNRQ